MVIVYGTYALAGTTVLTYGLFVLTDNGVSFAAKVFVSIRCKLRQHSRVDFVPGGICLTRQVNVSAHYKGHRQLIHLPGSSMFVVRHLARFHFYVLQANCYSTRNGPRPRQINGLCPEIVVAIRRRVRAHGLQDSQVLSGVVKGCDCDHVRFARGYVVSLFLHIKRVANFRVNGVAVRGETMVIHSAIRRFRLRCLNGTRGNERTVAYNVLQLVCLQRGVLVNVSPRNTIPSVLRIMIQVIQASVRKLNVIRMATRRINVRVLNRLGEPILPLSMIMVRVSTLLSSSGASTVFIVINLRILIHRTKLIHVSFLGIPHADRGRRGRTGRCCGPLRVGSPSPSWGSRFGRGPRLHIMNVP